MYPAQQPMILMGKISQTSSSYSKPCSSATSAKLKNEKRIPETQVFSDSRGCLGDVSNK